jgi:integrase
MKDFEADLQRLGPDAVRVLLETGYYRRQDEQTHQAALEHAARLKQARRTLSRLRKRYLLTEDDRAEDNSERFVYEWSDEEIQAVIEKAEELDRRPAARQEYASLIRSAIETGARLGELLGSTGQTSPMSGTSSGSGRSTTRSRTTRRPRRGSGASRSHRSSSTT